MFSRLFQKLSAKLIAGFSIILMLSIGVNIFAIYQLQRVQDVAIEISENWMPSIYLLSDINTQISNYMNRQQQHIFSLSEVEMAANERIMDDIKNLVQTYESQYEALLNERLKKTGDQEAFDTNNGLFQTYKVIYKDYLKASNQILEYSRLNNKEQAKQQMREESFRHYEECSQVLTQLILNNNNGGSEAADRSREFYSFAYKFIYVASFLSLLVSVIVAFVIVRSLRRQIGGEPSDIAQMARKVAEGDLTMTFKGRLVDDDSIYSSVRQMVETLRNIAELTNNIAKGDLSRRVGVRSDKDLLAISINQMIDNFKNIISQAKVIAKGDYSADIEIRGEHDELSAALQLMTESLRQNKSKTSEQNWIKDGLNQLSQQLSGNLSLRDMANKAVGFLARYTEAAQGVLYIYDPDNEVLRLYGTFAFTERNSLSNQYKIGEGIIGQVALERQPILLRNIRREEMTLSTGLTEEPPKSTFTLPLMFESELYGVLEIAGTEVFNGLKRDFLEQAMNIVSTYIYSVLQTDRIKGLLAISEEATRSAETRAKEIAEVNAQLENQRKQLENQSNELQHRNESLISAKEELDRRAEELELSNRYKSEFLANMSHELRTPLNSIIMLSKMLSKNDKKNLNQKDVKKAQIINKSGEELLRLINDILDLSKIEAGKMTIHTSRFTTQEFVTDMHDLFMGNAMEKNLKFETNDIADVELVTDKERLYQIARNFLSNAFKFTKKGQVTLSVSRKDVPEDHLRISVHDTGIGIPSDKQEVIFEAFKQADGTTSREFGGTGLGLSIVRELTKLLQGEIEVHSQPEKGSTFSIIIPIHINEDLIDEEGIPMVIKKHANGDTPAPTAPVKRKPAPRSSQPPMRRAVVPETHATDDRESVFADDKLILIVEDEVQFAEGMAEIIAPEGFKTVIAHSGEEGLRLAREYMPDGIILDLGLPDMDGVAVLDRFKSDKEIRHIPIEIVSARDKDMSLISKGAIGFLQKPIDEASLKGVMADMRRLTEKTIKDLLVVEDDDSQLHAIKELLVGDDVKVKGVRSKKEAISEIKKGIYDGAIVDLGLRDGNGQEICDYINENYPKIPVIIYTGKSLEPGEERELRKAAQSIILKTTNAEDQLKDEVAIFLHRMEKEIAEEKEQSKKSRQEASERARAKKLEEERKKVELRLPEPEKQTESDPETSALADQLLSEIGAKNDIDKFNEATHEASSNTFEALDKLKPSGEGKQGQAFIEPTEVIKKWDEAEAKRLIKDRNILVVDDDIRNIFVIASALENFEANILEAMDGKQALEILEKEEVELVMMDTIMPEMDGLETIQHIRAHTNEVIEKLPIIAITGKAQQQDREEVLKAGANAYIVKPVDYDELLNAVCYWLNQH